MHTDTGRYQSGVFATAEEAYKARCAAVQLAHGEYAHV
jgi:hypothetical protein